ncbi:tyrosine-type recombinase/integrase [Candidatus Terasakiella magnetica]|nr:site-specific integrase [Candidatus Terasakiella magnetica]
MPKTKLTSLSVGKLPIPPKGQVDYFDTSMPSFGVRLSLSGSRTYFVMTRVYGKVVRLSIGRAKVNTDDIGFSLKDARAKAGELVDIASKGIDPRQLKRIEKEEKEAEANKTFKAVAEKFIKRYVEPRLAPSTKREYDRALFGKEVKAWQSRPVDVITKADVRNLLEKMVRRGSAGAANNRLAYLRKFFNWCAEEDYIEHPPTDRIRPPGPKKIGERVLTEDEIKLVWAAFDAEGGTFGDLFKLLLLTGQRRAEVGGMRRDELKNIDGGNPTWEIPSHRTKNKRPHIIPLSPQAVAIIKHRPVFGDEGLLFTNTGDTPVSGYGKIKKRVDDWVAKNRENACLSPMPSWVLHDLRRTMVTIMNENLKTPPHVVEACVNHVSGAAKMGVAGVYNKALYIEERKKSLNAWGVFVEKLTCL